MKAEDVDALDKIIEFYVEKMFQDNKFKEACDTLKNVKDGLIANLAVYHICKKIQEL